MKMKGKKEKKEFRVDMHVHTRGSDGISSPEEIARAAIAAGLDGLCITDHHHTYTAEGLEVAAACRAVGLKVYHGCEYTTADGHCLVYGVDVDQLNFGYYPAMQDVIDVVVAAGGVAFPSHPYHGYKTLCGDKVKTLRQLVALEGRNGQVAVSAPMRNEEALMAAKGLKLPVTGGSDAHFAHYVGICYTRFESLPQTDADLVVMLRKGNYTAGVMVGKVEKAQLTSVPDYQGAALRDAETRMDNRESMRRNFVTGIFPKRK